MIAARPASLVDWSMSPAWVTVDQAAFLTGLKPDVIYEELIGQAGVETIDLADAILIDRNSLRDFWEILHDSGCR